jgi:hypothetical protein
LRRLLAVAKTPAAARELLAKFFAAAGGASFVKCLPDLVGTTDAAARYHMHPVMVTVPFDAGGRTVQDLLALLGTAAA